MSGGDRIGVLGSLVQDYESCRSKQHAKEKVRVEKGALQKISCECKQKTEQKKYKIKMKSKRSMQKLMMKVISSRSPVTAELQAVSVADWSSEEHCCYPTAAAAEGRMTERMEV